MKYSCFTRPASLAGIGDSVRNIRPRVDSRAYPAQSHLPSLIRIATALLTLELHCVTTRHATAIRARGMFGVDTGLLASTSPAYAAVPVSALFTPGSLA